MKILLIYFLLLFANSTLCQNINFKTFNMACDSMTFYDIVSNYSFEISDNEKVFAQNAYNKYNNIVSKYRSQHFNDSTEITISIMSNYINYAYTFKAKGQYYLSLKSSDRFYEYYMFKLTQSEVDTYWNPFLSDMYFNNFITSYEIFNEVGYSIGCNYLLSDAMVNLIKYIDSKSSFEITHTFRLFSKSDLKNNIEPSIVNNWYSILCEEIKKRHEDGTMSDVEYFLCNTLLLEYLESNRSAKLSCSIDFNKVYQKIVDDLKSNKIKTMEGAFFFRPYLKWLINSISDNNLNHKIYNNAIKELIDIGIYKNRDDVFLDLSLTDEDTRTLNFIDFKELKEDFNKILFCNRNYDNKLIERNSVENFGYQSYTAIKFIKNTSSKIDYNKFVFDFLNLFDFEKTDKQILQQINKIPELSELSYFSVFEYQLRNKITDTLDEKYIGIKDVINKLDTNEAFIYTSDIDLNFGKAIDNPNEYVSKSAKVLFVITKNKPPKLFILNNFIDEDFYTDYNISISSNLRIPKDAKNTLTGINKIYTFDDPWPWVLLDTDGNYICHNYEFHKITSLSEIINKSNNLRLDYIGKDAIIYSNPEFNILIENAYSQNDNKQTDIARIRGSSEDLGYYFNNNNNSGKEKILLSPLPNTEIEAKGIIDILNKNKIKTIWYNRSNAKEEYIYNNTNPFILHFATHGTSLYKDSLDKAFLFYHALTFCNSSNTINNDYYSFIGNKYDGLLTGLEIVKLNLSQTELVVLSACETGKGTAENWINGTYYNSLQRAFRLAGAKAVLASKWKVPDEPTQELMTEFYTNWLEKGMTKHKALQQAQLTLSKKYPNPYNWAAWVLYGE